MDYQPQPQLSEFIDIYNNVNNKFNNYSLFKLINCSDNNFPSWILYLENNYQTYFYLIWHALDLNQLNNEQISKVLSINIQMDRWIQWKEIQDVKQKKLAQFQQFCKTFKKCPNLIIFSTTCHFDYRSAQDFIIEIPFIFNSHSSRNALQKIDLDFSLQYTLSNKDSAFQFFNDLSSFKSLKFLNLRLKANGLKDTTIEFLSNCISSLHSLQQFKLEIPCNSFSQQGAQLICQGISNLSHNLLILDLVIDDYINDNLVMDQLTCINMITSITQCLLLHSILLDFGSHSIGRYISSKEIIKTGITISLLFSKLVFLNRLVLLSFMQVSTKASILIRKNIRLTTLLIN